jgi:hypothetical protein
LPILKLHLHPSLLLIALCGIIGCSDDPISPPADEPEDLGQKNTSSSTATEKKKLEFPLVYIEELDQFQEYYKDQHTTSFSHVPSKNWFSFTAGKDGVLTKILLFGKANVLPNEYYGLSMSGFILEGNPLTGPKYGAWKLSRDDILNQLAAQSLTERESGWITIRMRGEIPQESGQTYFLVCDRIDEKSWFGDFAFGEGNPYKAGRNWLHSEHDLVFRTYVGKTQDQIEKQQMIRKLKELEAVKNKEAGNGANSPPPAPIPLTPRPPDPSTFEKQPPAEESAPLPTNTQPGVLTEPILPDQNATNKSLFNRLHKKP